MGRRPGQFVLSDNHRVVGPQTIRALELRLEACRAVLDSAARIDSDFDRKEVLDVESVPQFL